MKNIQKVVFFGTTELAVPALGVLEDLALEIQLVVTRPRFDLAPNPMARTVVEPPPHPVKRWAQDRGISVFTSRQAAEGQLHEKIFALQPDLLVVAEYGRALPEKLLPAAERGALQVHPSALPKLRGPHAIRAAIGQGLRKTGVTVFRVDGEPWGGPILLAEEVLLEEEETFGEVVPKIQQIAGRMLSEGLQMLDRSKKPKTRAQNAKAATKTPKITARHRRTPWQLKADEVYNRWRAHAPPGLITSVGLKSLEILRGKPLPGANVPFGETGTYLGVRSGKLAILCGRQTAFGIEEVRLEGEDEGRSASEVANLLGLQVGQQFI